MAKKINTKDILQADTFLYKLPLVRHFILLLSTLNEHFGETPTGYKRMMGIWAHYLSFKRELVRMKVHVNASIPDQVVQFHVSPGELEISCDCGMPGDKLCTHAYFALKRILHYDGPEVDLSCFYWESISKRKGSREVYLDIEPHNHYIKIEPQKRFGDIFRPQIGFEHFTVEKLEAQAKSFANDAQRGKRPAIGYCIIRSYRRKEYSLPILVPLWGLTDMADRRIVTFKNYLIDKPVPEEIELSLSQQKLNEICKQMWLLEAESANSGDRSIEYEKREHLLFGLWQQAFHASLSAERDLFVNWMPIKTIRKDKPTRGTCRPIELSAGKVRVSFLLTEQEDYYLLEPRMINEDGKEVRITNDTPRFFVSSFSHLNLHLLSSVQDSILLEQLFESDNRLTIVKAHFAEFEHKYLLQLSECYEVAFKGLASKKRVPYRLGLIGLGKSG